KMFEVSASLYPVFTGHADLAPVMRTFVDRYVQLAWWARLATGVIDQIVQNLTSAEGLLQLVEPLVPIGVVGNQVGAPSPLAYGHGVAEVQRLQQKYAQNAEAQRLFASGLLDPALYQGADYEPCHRIVIDGLTRLGASSWTDDAFWPRFSRHVMRAAAIRSLL